MVAIAVEHRPDCAQVFVCCGVIDSRDGAARPTWVIRQRWALADEVDHVGSKPVDPTVQPELQCLVHRVANRSMVPVEVRLFRQEQMQVVLAGLVIERPRRHVAKCRAPVVRRPAARGGVAPDIPVTLVVVSRRSRCSEPRVFARRVVGNPVEGDAETVLMAASDQFVGIGECAEDRVDVAVVGDVVAEVMHGRREDRRDPQCVDTERRDVRDPLRDAGEVTDAIAVRVGERTGIDLVEDS